METAQQHEWVNTGWGQLTCTHCKVKVDHDFLSDIKTYHTKHGIELLTEPPCITRHPAQEAGKNEKV